MIFLRTLFFFTVFWLHQLLILPLLAWYWVAEKRRGAVGVRPRIARISREWGRMVCWLGGARVRVEDRSGVGPDEAVLLVSNHQGEFDIPILLGFAGRPLGFVAKKELENIPLVSAWMRLMKCVFLDRQNRRRQVQQVRDTIETLKSGHSMVIFPEGTRSGSDEMGPFAKGSLNIADKAGVRVVPARLSGSWRLKPPGKLGLRGGAVDLTLLPAMDPASLSAGDKARLHEIVWERIAAAADHSSAG